MTSHRKLIGVALVCMALPLLYAVITFAARPEPSSWLDSPKSGTGCVLPKARMRTEHMKYLKSLRDEVVRSGIRNRAGQGISGCRSCHANRAQFCDRCHARASVSPDCFGCHPY